MLIKNCRIILYDRIIKGSVLIDKNKITRIIDSENEKSLDDYNVGDVVDAKGMYLSPGFIDVHIHGAGGYDTMDGSYDAINGISKTIANHGTTSFLPTTMTCDLEKIKNAIEAVSIAKKRGTYGAQVLGVHLEGPFISPEQVGAQNPKYVQKPSIESFEHMVGENVDIVKSITLAPEVSGCKKLVEYLHKLGIIISIGHSKANYGQAMEAIKWGFNHATHLYNAMTGLHHREPGIVGAVFDSGITTETIADGIHISFPALRIAYKQKGIDKVILITDAMMACGMSDGNYKLGGLDVVVKNGSARLKDGTLAGSVLTLDKAVRNVYNNSNYKLYEVVRMATFNPARHCKVEDRKGLIKEGYDADLILFDDDINIKNVIVGGKLIK